MQLQWIQYFFQAGPDHGYAGRPTGNLSDLDPFFAYNLGKTIIKPPADCRNAQLKMSARLTRIPQQERGGVLEC